MADPNQPVEVLARPGLVRFTKRGNIDVFINPEAVDVVTAGRISGVEITIIKVGSESIDVLEPIEDVVEKLSTGNARIYEPIFVKPGKRNPNK